MIIQPPIFNGEWRWYAAIVQVSRSSLCYAASGLIGARVKSVCNGSDRPTASSLAAPNVCARRCRPQYQQDCPTVLDTARRFHPARAMPIQNRVPEQQATPPVSCRLNNIANVAPIPQQFPKFVSPTGAATTGTAQGDRWLQHELRGHAISRCRRETGPCTRA